MDIKPCVCGRADAEVVFDLATGKLAVSCDCGMRGPLVAQSTFASINGAGKDERRRAIDAWNNRAKTSEDTGR